jgi:SAM-dependent methyltransferase
MRSFTWLDQNEIQKLPFAHGVAAEPLSPRNVLEGWVFHPEQELDAVQVFVDGRGIAYVPLFDRPDVAAVYPDSPHAVRSGYQLILPTGLLCADDVNRVAVAGCYRDRPCVRKTTFMFEENHTPQVPIPPPSLIKHTQGDEDGVLYRKLGYLFYREVLDLVGAHRDLGTIRRVLDWGCGSGRVTANFLADHHGFAVDGCDPHAESIAWCQTNLTGGRFQVSQMRPPLPYPDAQFDFVLGLGVVYLLNRDEFADWLRELKRITAINGVLVISIQGLFAAQVRFPAPALDSLRRDGILDAAEVDRRYPPASAGHLYRRGFFWTPEAIQQTAARYFRVIDYLEGAFTSDHDYVILERAE